MFKCSVCGKSISSTVASYCDRVMASKNLPSQHYCLHCQVAYGINQFDPKKLQDKPIVSKVKFEDMIGLRSCEVIKKVNVINSTDKELVEKHMIWSILKLLNHLNLLPKGYFTRVSNKSIKFKTARKMAMDKLQLSPYRVRATMINGSYYIALIEYIG